MALKGFQLCCPHVCFQLWHGYGGNIYFDAVRCHSMRINSAKPGEKRKPKQALRRKSKSCDPMNGGDLQQFHVSCIPRVLTQIPDPSINNLGSLRVKSSKAKKCRAASCMHGTSTRRLSGKVCKGFSDPLIAETLERLKKHRRYSSAPEDLSVSGGKVTDSLLDPIDSVQKSNAFTRPGRETPLTLGSKFPTLLSEASFFSHQGESKHLFALNANSDPSMKLPLLRKAATREGMKKTTNFSNADDDVKHTSDPKQVFIIPFGAFDDPVDTGGIVDADAKRKQEQSRKSASATCNNSSDEEKTAMDTKKQSLSDRNTEAPFGCSHGVRENSCETCVHENSGKLVRKASRDVVSNERVRVHPGAPKQTLLDFHLKREISSISLSNYLRTIPSQLPKNPSSSLRASKSSSSPKLAYTQRSKGIPAFCFLDSSVHLATRSTGHAHRIYGGYFPSHKADSQAFYAEIRTFSPAGNTCTRDADWPGSHGASKSTQDSQQAAVKAKHVPRRSLSPAYGRDKPKKLNHPLRGRENDLLPLEGRQISRPDGSVGGLKPFKS